MVCGWKKEGRMSEQEREARMSDEPDVEGHRKKAAYTEGSEPPKEGAEARRDEGEEPDVEGHRHKA
jgi:hypothetical protein